MKRIAIILMLLLGIGAFFALHDEVPAWRPGGTNSLPLDSVAHVVPRAITIAPGATIELRGDSLVAGEGAGGDRLAYGQVLSNALGSEISVEAYGFGGFTAVMAESHWRNRKPTGTLVLLAFGTNDAAPRGWLASKEETGITAFEASLEAQAQAILEQRSEVALIAPPPAGSAAINARLEPYRLAVRDVGERLGVTVFDPADAFRSCKDLEPLLTADALHLNEAGQRCLGEWLAAQLASSVEPGSAALQ